VLQCRVKLIKIGLLTMISTLNNDRTGSSLLSSNRIQGTQILLMQGIVTLNGIGELHVDGSPLLLNVQLYRMSYLGRLIKFW